MKKHMNYHNYILKIKKKKSFKEKEKYYKFKNYPRTKFKPKSFINKNIGKQIKLIIGELKDDNKHLEGSGIKDIFNNVKNYFKPRLDGYNNKSSKNIKLYGDKPIISLTIYRTPIMKILDKALNYLSLNKFSTLKKKYGFDDLFHLALIANVGDKNIVIEKNEVINIDTSYKTDDKTETFNVNLDNKNITINDMLTKGREMVKDKTWFSYNPFFNNCQFFIKYCLSAVDLYNEETKNFLFQDLSDLAKELPGYVKTTANILTDTGAIVNKITGQAKPKLTEIQQKEKEFWRQNQAIRNKLSMETNEKNKEFMKERRNKKDEQKMYWDGLLSFLEQKGYDRNGKEPYLDFIKRYENETGLFPFPKKDKLNEWEWRQTKNMPITIEDFGLAGTILKNIGLGSITTNLLNVYNNSTKFVEKPSLSSAIDAVKSGVDAVKETYDLGKTAVNPKDLAVKLTKNVINSNKTGGCCRVKKNLKIKELREILHNHPISKYMKDDYLKLKKKDLELIIYHYINT